jgi:pyrimidine oxygenase
MQKARKPRMATPRKKIQFGIFLPIGSGGWIISKNAPRVDGSFELNKQAVMLAEQFGLDFALTMMKWRGFGGPTNHWGVSLESMMLMSALAQHTSRIKVWCTVHTLLHNPAVAAKMVATLDHVSHGRAGMNIVSGSYHDEFEKMGTWRDDFDHDGRYDYAGEWIAAVKRLWTEPRVDFDDKYFKLTDCVSDPKPVSKPGPTLICAGISDIGLRLTAKYADAAFVFGKDEAEIGARSRRAKELGAEYGRAISTLTYCTVISGATDEEAEERVQHYRAGQDHGTVDGMADAYSHNPRQDGKANTLVLRARETFMTPVLSGSPATLRRKIGDTIRGADLDGMMFIFPDFIEDQKFFGEQVLPELRRDFA